MPADLASADVAAAYRAACAGVSRRRDRARRRRGLRGDASARGPGRLCPARIRPARARGRRRRRGAVAFGLGLRGIGTIRADVDRAVLQRRRRDMFIAFQAPLLEELLAAARPEMSVAALAAAARCWSARARSSTGWAPLLGRVVRPPRRANVFRLILATQIVAFVSSCTCADPWVFGALVCYVLLCYGGGFGTAPSLVADAFGTRVMRSSTACCSRRGRRRESPVRSSWRTSGISTRRRPQRTRSRAGSRFSRSG